MWSFSLCPRDQRARPRSLVGIDREQLLSMRYAAQRVAAHRDQAAFQVSNLGESRRHQDGLIQGAAHRRDPACFVHGRAYHGEIEALAAADVTEEYFADM